MTDRSREHGVAEDADEVAHIAARYHYAVGDGFAACGRNLWPEGRDLRLQTRIPEEVTCLQCRRHLPTGTGTRS